MIIRLMFFFTVFILKTEAMEREIAEQIFAMDEPTLKATLCTHMKKPTTQKAPDFVYAYSDAELRVYGKFKTNESLVFKEMCMIAALNHPVWQIYLSRMFYEGREWLPKNLEMSHKLYQMVCNNTYLIEETYDLVPFARVHLAYLQDVFRSFEDTSSLPDRFQTLAVTE